MAMIPDAPKAKLVGATGAQPLTSPQSELLPYRISSILPITPNGADIAMVCVVHNGGMYYCKSDQPGRHVRATEWLATKIASHLGLLTAPCAVIENESGETFFGSLNQCSTAGSFQAPDFLLTRRVNELGQPSPWPGQYLAQLLAFDMFMNNPDRSLQNFVLVSDGVGQKLCAIDFAAVRLSDLSGYQFPVAESVTIKIGRAMRATHGKFPHSMIETVDRIDAIPLEVVKGLISGLPPDWLPEDQGEKFCENWASPTLRARTAKLRAGIADGSLL